LVLYRTAGTKETSAAGATKTFLRFIARKLKSLLEYAIYGVNLKIWNIPDYLQVLSDLWIFGYAGSSAKGTASVLTGCLLMVQACYN
jgi:hypothetical protein